MCDFVSLLLFAKHRDSIKTHCHHSTGFCTNEDCNFDVFAIVLVAAAFLWTMGGRMMGGRMTGEEDEKSEETELAQTGLGF